MTTAPLTEPTDAPPSANIADRLRETARLAPDQPAVILPPRRSRPERRVRFAELDRDADRIARGLHRIGVRPGHRLVLMVRPGGEFIALTFGLFRSGATVVLIDPGMGLRRVLRCLTEVDPDGFVAIPVVHAVRKLRRGLFPNARFNVCVGTNWFRDAVSYRDLLADEHSTFPRSSPLSLGRGVGGGSSCASKPIRRAAGVSLPVRSGRERVQCAGEAQTPPLTPDPSPQGEGDRNRRDLGELDVETWPPPAVAATDAAAIIFTSGGTGPPKGVVYEHGMFAAQVELLRERFDIRPGEIDLPGFPLFALFNAAMQVTTVVPDIDPTRPAKADPRKILDPIRRYGVTQAFGSPALWNRVGRHCERTGETIPHLKRALSAGAPVPLHVLKRMTTALTEPGADLHTPYGATEALPVATIAASEVLAETAELSRCGAGTCVGTPFPHVWVKIIEITDGPIGSISDVRELPPGEIGEIVVSSPSATREYFRRPRETELAKIPDGDRFWHRMGDVGYLDGRGRLWFCGRKAHVVETAYGRMFSVCCEAVFNEHPDVYRSALVGVGPKGRRRPVIVVELEGFRGRIDDQLRDLAKANPLTEQIDTFLYHSSFPVDVRHNIKIDRERLGRWAAKRMGVREGAR